MPSRILPQFFRIQHQATEKDRSILLKMPGFKIIVRFTMIIICLLKGKEDEQTKA